MKLSEKKSMTIKDYIRQKALRYLNGAIDSNINPQTQADRLTFINNIDDIKEQKLKEYNVWYSGDSDEIMNFYTKKDMIDYNTDPIYSRNKKSYFWSVASTEGDIKRTHSGQPRNVVDTLVNIIGTPKISCDEEFITKRLNEILEDNDFTRMFAQEQLPLTLVEGWGCWKINYDLAVRDTPILLYYRADSVDFIYKSNQLIAIVTRDYYQDEKKQNYVLFETRRVEKKTEKGIRASKLVIEKDLFRMSSSDIIMPCDLKELPQLRDVEPVLELKDYDGFLAVPCVVYKDSTEDTYGRSIFTGKLDLFDDLDQCLSQSANTVRRSTVQEYFNSNYLEKNEMTGLPIMPHSFDRKYVLFNGGVDANGATGGQEPVHVTQPAVNMQQYDMEAQNILIHVISGIISPATLGIDVAKKDNAEAQREKEKVTIFTRNLIIAEEVKILKKLCNELLCAWELMNQDEITCRAYSGLDIHFDEFADASLERKAETLLGLYNSGVISPELFIDMLYGDRLSEEKKQAEISFIKQMQQAMQPPQPDTGEEEMSPDEMAQLGAVLGGNNNNPVNASRANLETMANPEFAG